MSFLQVNGITASSASHHSSLRTSLSSSFLDRVRDGRLASTTRQLVTTFVPGFGPFGMVMDCETHSANEVDIILGFEWAAHIRDFLQASGYRLNRTFDAWTFLVDPSHPIGEFAVPLAPASLSYTGVPTTAHGFSSAHVAAHPGIDSGLGASHDAVRVPSPHLPVTMHSETLNSENFDSIPYLAHNSNTHVAPDQPQYRKHCAPFTSAAASVGSTAGDSLPVENLERQPEPAGAPETGPVAGPSRPRNALPLLAAAEIRGTDALERLLLSAQPNANIFAMNQQNLQKLMKSHHVPCEPHLSIEDARTIMLLHLLSGSCISACDPAFRVEHPCHCREFSSVFPESRDMVFQVLSILLSASEARLPDSHVAHIMSSMGLPDRTRLRFHLQLSARRRSLLHDHSDDVLVKELFNRLEDLPKASLLVLAQSHGIKTVKARTSEQLKASIVHHISLGSCVTREGYSSPLACSATVHQVIDTPTPGTGDDPATCLQIRILRQIAPILRSRAMKRLLNMHDIKFREADTLAQLRKLLKNFLRSLVTGKYGEDDLTLTGSAQKARARLHAKLRAQWPQVVSNHLKRKLEANFNIAISSSTLATFVCGSCTENCPIDHKCTLSFEDFDINLLKRPDEYIDGEEDDSDPGDLDSVSGAPAPWLDARCPDPPMPLPDNHTYQSLLVDAECLEVDPETMDTVLVLCRRCRNDLKAKRVPALSMANRNYLGPIPDELKGLTVVEEAMIALCRAKCWIIQLREESSESSLPFLQRGVRGHIIVYPQRPSAVATTLPPSISDVTTPICVVFVGSQPPTAEWLQTKATPLIVRKERVLDALNWLKTHNHLYREVIIDKTELEALPDEAILPFHIQHVLPNTGIDVTTSDYVPGSAQPDVPQLSDILQPPPSNVPFQSVVVADVDGNAPSSELRSAALRHLKTPGSNYIEIPHDPNPANEFKNPHLFPMMYPTLFPYGLGGLEDKHRPTKLGFKRHIKHLFNLADRRFQEHYSFLFTAFNMVQRRALLLRTHLKAKRSNFDHIAAQFGTVSPASIHIVAERVAAGDNITANNPEERRVLRLMKEVSLVNSCVPGSSQSKLVMRNQIRALMIEKGLPSFYITINPADVYNPLVKFLAGDDINLDSLSPKDVPDYLQQSITIARNPTVGARFFNIYLKAFIKTILACDPDSENPDEGGILGVVKAYYGTVEAQGRGSLHCHMMVWVAGGLNPNEIKEKALENGGNTEFQERLITYLDDTISTAIPPDSERTDLETPLCKFHPCATRGPGPGIDPGDLADAEQRDLHKLAERCQRHRHTATCYKYWSGYPAPRECRFDLDKDNETPVSVFDSETGEFHLRTLDGLVNNFNETMLRAIRCNMDIKFIGSGPAAKAILYYITDYITKSQLQAHVAYAALEGAVHKLGEFNPEEDDLTGRAKRLLQRCAHSLISKQELSAQQVVSYLMEFEDHFTDHKYVNLFWTSFEGFINMEDPSPECYPTKVVPNIDSSSSPQTDDVPENADGDVGEEVTGTDLEQSNEDSADLHGEDNDEITLTLDGAGKLVPTASQICDYQRRGDLLDRVSVWDFVAQTEKLKLKRKASFEFESDDDEPEIVEDATLEDQDTLCTKDNILDFEGRCRPRVRFQNSHLEDSTHVIKVNSFLRRKVPVPIGPALPKRQDPAFIEKHSRLMLILFKPWRHASDLRAEGQSWSDAYADFIPSIPADALERIENMQLLHECKDSRDAHYADRRNRRRAGLTLDTSRGLVSDEFGEESDESLLQHLDSMEASRSLRADSSRADIVSALGYAQDCGLLGQGTRATFLPDPHNSHMAVHETHPEAEALWSKAYESRKEASRRTALSPSGTSSEPVVPRPTEGDAGIRNGSAFRDFISAPMQPQLREAEGLMSRAALSNGRTSEQILDTPGIIAKHTLNTEQARAFSLVAEHSMAKGRDPLRMYLGGPGGTGKSRVIDALQDFFVTRQQPRRFRLASYTGVAARNISGMTLHASLMLGDYYKSALSAKSKRDLMSMWEGVDYLFIDEISMVGCSFLYDISHALSVAKGNDLAFGGISIVFAGDFAQLPPVGQKRLYAHLDTQTISRAGTKAGQKVVFGKLLWLSVTTVVFLSESMRQIGPENRPFVELLGRLREGRCTVADYELLNTRLASRLDIDWDSEKWRLAPIIVAENAMKDALNVQMAENFAAKTGRRLHWYYAQDAHSKRTPVTNPDLLEKLMQADSGKTNSRLGKIPLVIGMPVMISQNFDVEGGVVNGCTGILVSVRYRLGPDGKRYALSCVVEAPNTTPGILPDLPAHHVVSLRDTVQIKFQHPHSKKVHVVNRTQLPVIPAFAMTAHKAQGKTLVACVVNFTGCKGSESPYVMVSRATSLDGLVVLTPFPKERICCRQNEDLRLEFRRLRYHALRTVQSTGTGEEAELATSQLSVEYAPTPALAVAESEDVGVRLHQMQLANAALTAPVTQSRERLPLDTPIGSTARPTYPQQPGGRLVFLPPTTGITPTTKRRLDDTSPMKLVKSSKRQKR